MSFIIVAFHDVIFKRNKRLRKRDDDDDGTKWLTARATFLSIMAIKHGFSKEPPSQGILTATEKGIQAPFRRPEFQGIVAVVYT